MGDSVMGRVVERRISVGMACGKGDRDGRGAGLNGGCAEQLDYV